MHKIVKIPLSFLATRMGEGPLNISFFKENGERVDPSAVKRIKTKKGIRLFLNTAQK